jgi:hypothetical protein
VLAAKTEFKTVASKIIQHPAVTIERIKLRRRVIELSVQTRLGGAAAFNQAAATPNCHSACNIDPLSRGIGVQN